MIFGPRAGVKRRESNIHIVCCCVCGESTNAMTVESGTRSGTLEGWAIVKWPDPGKRGELYCPCCAKKKKLAVIVIEKTIICVRCKRERPASEFSPDCTFGKPYFKQCVRCRNKELAMRHRQPG